MIAYQDDLSFLRIANVPKRNLGERRMNFLKEYAQAQDCTLYQALCRTIEEDVFKGTKAKDFLALIRYYSSGFSGRPISELLSALLNDSGYEEMLRTEGSQERLDNLAELKQSVYEYETTCGEESTLEHYLAHVALFSNSDAASRKDQVKLMTVHAAKGLEFPYVFLCGMNEGIFPSRKVRTLPGMEEERRLAFVAMDPCQKGPVPHRSRRAQSGRLSPVSLPFYPGYRPEACSPMCSRPQTALSKTPGSTSAFPADGSARKTTPRPFPGASGSVIFFSARARWWRSTCKESAYRPV